MADLLCHRSFFSCKDNTLNVRINNNNNTITHSGLKEELYTKNIVVVVSHTQVLVANPKKYFTRWPIPFVVC